MDDAKLWEMALLLGVGPEEHGIPTLTVNMTAFEYLEQCVKNWGIPAMAFDRWNRLLEVADDYDENE